VSLNDLFIRYFVSHNHYTALHQPYHRIICFLMLHTHFHCLLPHQNTVTVGGFTAFLGTETHFAEVTKVWDVFAINWPYELVVGLCSCVTFLRDSSEAVSGACCWASLHVASIMYCERRSLCGVLRSLPGTEVILEWLLLKWQQMLPLHFIRYNWPALFEGILVTCSSSNCSLVWLFQSAVTCLLL